MEIHICFSSLAVLSFLHIPLRMRKIRILTNIFFRVKVTSWSKWIWIFAARSSWLWRSITTKAVENYHRLRDTNISTDPTCPTTTWVFYRDWLLTISERRFSNNLSRKFSRYLFNRFLTLIKWLFKPVIYYAIKNDLLLLLLYIETISFCSLSYKKRSWSKINSLQIWCWLKITE